MPDPKPCQRLAEQMLSLALKAGRRRRRGAGARRLRAGGEGPAGRAGAGQGGGQPGAGAAGDQGPARGGDLHVGLQRRAGWSGWPGRPSSWRRWPSRIPLAALPARERDGAGGPRAGAVGRRRCWRIDVARGDPAGAARARRRRWRSDKRVTNSEGAVFGRVMGASAFATSAGFSGSYRGHQRRRSSVEPVCDDEDGKKRNGYYWTVVALQGAAAGRRGGGPGGGAPHGGQAGVAQGGHLRGAGDLLARGRRAACWASWPG